MFRIGRNVARALWDYYKILGVIPLDPDAVTASHGADKNGCVRSFNLLRLREIEQQRNQTAFTFDIQARTIFCVATFFGVVKYVARQNAEHQMLKVKMSKFKSYVGFKI